MSLLAKAKKEGQIQHITPLSAGWKYIGFDVWMLKKGQTVTLESGDRELCLVLVAGYDSYYLNVMAGPDRKWMFTWEEDHAWINSPDYPRHD